MPEVREIDSSALEATLLFRDWAPLTVRVDPTLMAAAYPRLKIGGSDFWPQLAPQEAAWRMLSVEMFDCLESVDEWVETIQLSVTGPFPGFTVVVK
jgi:hypothetical protein